MRLIFQFTYVQYCKTNSIEKLGRVKGLIFFTFYYKTKTVEKYIFLVFGPQICIFLHFDNIFQKCSKPFRVIGILLGGFQMSSSVVFTRCHLGKPSFIEYDCISEKPLDFRHYRIRFSTPGTPWPIPMDKMWYSFDVGLVHFIRLAQ